MIKTRRDNDVTDRIDMLSAKNETELLWPIKLGTIYEKK